MIRHPYQVHAADRCGPYATRPSVTFDAALDVVREFINRWPDKFIYVSNPRESDEGNDGLTDDEREEMHAVINDMTRDRYATYQTRFVQERSAETVANSAELAALLADQTNGEE